MNTSINTAREHRRMRTVVAAPLAAALMALLTSCGGPSTPRERDVLLGGLFSLTGNWSTLGQASRAAMELAVEDVNRYLAGNPAHVHFVAAIEDTRLDPGLALQKAKTLRARGVQLLIGPQSSAEVAALKSFVDSTGILLVSQSSTASSLAINGDNVFRFTPSDILEGVATAALLWSDGIRAIVPVWRDDAGNTGVASSVRNGFNAVGGTVLGGIKYGTSISDFRPVLRQLSGQLRQAIQQHGAKRVAVHVAAFDEIVDLFNAAGDDELLRSVRWYGSDGVARSQAVTGNRQAAEFAMRVNFPNALFGMEEGARDVWQPLAARIRGRTRIEADAFALAVYDAVWVVARGFVASGAKLGITELKHAFTTAASTHFGATGWTVLNAAGDRKYGDFDFWAIRDLEGELQWTRVAGYQTRTGRVVR